MKNFFGNLVFILPSPLAFSIYNLTTSVRLPKVYRDRNRAEKKIYKKLGQPRSIVDGAFQGMLYLSQSYGSSLLPKILGTYESELNFAVEQLCKINADLIIDIGSAEGYYAVGMAIRNPNARLVCYDIYKPARLLLARLAKINQVAERIKIKSLCNAKTLNQILSDSERPIVICDIEGAEEDVLKPNEAPNLKGASILVELHEGMREGVTKVLRNRFSKSHEIKFYDVKPRNLDDFPAKLNNIVLTSKERKEAMEEYREGCNGWYFMLPKS